MVEETGRTCPGTHQPLESFCTLSSDTPLPPLKWDTSAPFSPPSLLTPSPLTHIQVYLLIVCILPSPATTQIQLQ